MFIWLIIIIKIACFNNCPVKCSTIPPYECGSHGRFEYCIDGIPGCVVGCHCHPGYYFDTTTKICEPNAKLTEDYRRHYYQEPTRVNFPVSPSPVITLPTTASSSAIDDKIDEITNDADDLGDWLYNQFFKTIENQVINNTKNENIEQTRRTNSETNLNKRPSRRHKYKKAKRKKRKRKGLKNKLLRITEDDSLFDSSSESSSDDSSGSASSESSGDDKRVQGDINTDDHGHKKILVVNKRPRPQLPSFIFLPNMDTPFFPPIGLPPAPVPMYPMVPVPPMIPQFPPYPYPVLPHIHEDEEITTSQKTTTTINSSCSEKNTEEPSKIVTSSPLTTEPKPDPVTLGPTTDPVQPEPAKSRLKADPAKLELKANRLKSRPKFGPARSRPKSVPVQSELYSDPVQPNPYPDSENPKHDLEDDHVEKVISDRSEYKDIAKQKLMKQLREKMKRKNKLQHFFANEYQNLQPPYPDLDMPPEFIPNSRNIMPIMKEDARDELPPGLQDIDFKYLTQLIHKGNLNKTKHNTMHRPTNPPPAYKELKNMEANQHPTAPNRRNYFDTFYINEPVNYGLNIPNQQHMTPKIQDNSGNPINTVPKRPDQGIYPQPINLMPQAYNVYRELARNGFVNNPQHRRRTEETDDAYYTKLGRQIASMIRNAEGEVDIQIETNENLPYYMFNGINHNSRSYWERSVRSPYGFPVSFRTEMNRLKNSNENLFGLENEVAVAAATQKSFSLRELENIISNIDKTKSQLIKNVNRLHHPVRISKTSFNVNLLPKHNRPYHETKNNLVYSATDNNLYEFNATKRKAYKEPTITPNKAEVPNVLRSNFRKAMPGYRIIDNNNTAEIPVNENNFRSVANKPLQAMQAAMPFIPRPQVTHFSYFNSELQQTTHRNLIDEMTFNQKYNQYYNLNNDNFRNPTISKRYENFARHNAPSYFHSYSRDFDYFDK